MHIIALGLNHTSAPVQLRERLHFSEDQVRASLARLACGNMASPLSELVIVSTCNRIEIYAASNKLAFAELEAFLSDAHGVSIHEIHPHLYRFGDMDAVRHLYEVSAGLDSLVIGEPQILGQITKALELARGQNAAGPMLNRLFQAAIHTGKRARTETAISRNPASVSSLAASFVERVVQRIADAQVVILGAGEMAELAVEALRKRGANRILVGGGNIPRPGEISLAHRGVLFLDEFPEFGTRVLEVMRQPMEDKVVTISRAKGSLTFSANFQLIAAMNPCPCGYYGDSQKPCTPFGTRARCPLRFASRMLREGETACAHALVTKYQKRISGPLLDRIDIHIEVPRVDYEKLSGNRVRESSECIRARVQAARNIQQARFSNIGSSAIVCNADMRVGEIRQFCRPPEDASG